MKRILTLLLLTATVAVNSFSQGWPANYGGVMLQGFYWNSFDASRWTTLESQADELSQYFDLVWIPQSGYCGGQSMGYDDQYWFENYNSSFGNKTELLSLIKTFKSKGIGTIGDIVINHRRSNNGWFGFPAETYGGVTYTMGPSDVCSDDDGGKAAAEASRLGVTLGSKDSGEGWDGMRDLDHKSLNVQNTVKAYLKMLIDDFGYTGFRYDMVKGYSPEYTGMYNAYSKPQFSVGECWDGTQTIRNWIDGTKVDGVPTSAAFDFQFRYTVRNACNGTGAARWNALNQQNDNNWPLVSNQYESAAYRQWAVTFVENHDTEYRSAEAPQDPIKKDTLAANAWLLAMPGTPCVFLKHWTDCKRDIKMMINARRLAGITNTSSFNSQFTAGNGYVGARVGKNGSFLLCIVGDNAADYQPTAQWVEVINGYHYRYFLQNQLNVAWADLPSGKYDGRQQARLVAVTNKLGAKLVYTFDGTEPTTQSRQAETNTLIDIPVGKTTLKVGLLADGNVSGVQTREYEVTDFAPYNITVYVNTDLVGWNSVNFWTWGGNGTHSPKVTSWPGDKVTTTVTKNGSQWYAKEFRISSSDDFVNFVFSTNSGSPQTVNVENVSKTSYFVISTEMQGSNHLVTEGDPAGVDCILMPSASPVIYDLQGRRVASSESSALPRGVYVVQGKKYVVK